MRLYLWFSLIASMATVHCHAADISRDIEQRLQELSQQLAIPLPRLQEAVKASQHRQSVLDAISRPWEAKPWYQYRQLFITPGRISNGVRFWQENSVILQQAEQRWQVPAAIIVAIIGVETQYGTQMGTHPVLDALYTLGFHYAPRSAYFSKEFANYVKLADQENWLLRQPKGSYAGAMGMGQFMPTSYLHFAVDGDDDKHKDLFSKPADAIHSVAHYFAEHDWKYGAPVAHKAMVQDESRIAHLLGKTLELEDSWQTLSRQGVTIATELPSTTPVKLLRLDLETGSEYWVLESNFYTITRYNRSPLYAMAVYQLSEAIASAYDAK